VPGFRAYLHTMRSEGHRSDIIVVNLICSSPIWRCAMAPMFGAADYAAVILDEAHQIEDVASEYFGSLVSTYQI